jgi:hypothetical protein
MTTHNEGRHQGRHRVSAPGPSHQRGTAVDRPRASRVLRRPMASAAAVLAVAGATAAGYASAVKPHSVDESHGAGASASAQAAQQSQRQVVTNAALAGARRAGLLRASALAQQQKVATDARAAALARARQAQASALARSRAAQAAASARSRKVEAAQAAELAQARQVAQQRAARDQARQGLVARSQSNPRALAEMLVANHGWAASQFGCLDSLWTKESGWRWSAANASSGAYGIAQALPGSKMGAVGSDWATNPLTQITWGLGYISDRYGTPCAAWAHSQAMNWY